MDFNSQLDRMKGLYTYGTQVNENTKPVNRYSLEHSEKAADGKTYGIVRECNRYYIKSAETGKETIAEAYQYIGGFNNKSHYEYESYASALKNFNMKMSSINEACDGNVRMESIDPFRMNEASVKGTKKMQNEIARQRQIMYNASMLMNESTSIGKTPFSSQPESEHANSGDEDAPFTQSVTPDMDFDGKKSSCPKCEGEPFDKGEKSSKKAEKGKDVTVKDSVASQHPKGGKVARVNEEFNPDFEGGSSEYDPSELKSLLEDNLVRFTYTKKDGSVRHACGTRNPEILREYGVPMPEKGEQPEGMIKYIELDTDHVGAEDQKQGRFWKTCFEDKVDSIEEVISVADIMGGEESEDETEPAGIEGVDGEIGDIDELADDVDDIDGEESENDFDEEEIESDDNDDVVDLDSEEELDGDEDSVEDDEFEDVDDEMEDDSDEDEDFEDEDEEFENEEVDESDPESIRAEIERLQSLLGEIEVENDVEDSEAVDSEEIDDAEDAEDDVDVDDESEELNSDEDETIEDEDEMTDDERIGALNEIAQQVANYILKEDKLNVFGQHPGYGKEPMKLPETGSDSTPHGKDWNHSSVHSQEKFGKSKGNSKPYANAYERDALAMKLTDEIMSDLKKKQ